MIGQSLSEDKFILDFATNIYFEEVGTGYRVSRSDHLSEEQANTIIKISVLFGFLEAKRSHEDLLIIANVLALLVIKFKTDISALIDAPNFSLMIDILTILKAFDGSDFTEEPYLLSKELMAYLRG